jgi:aryl-alcohol dehydrogenase-like predicted oxidoreductase
MQGARVGRERLMEHRQLGRTGVSVSKLCLGAMMFGAWGNPDHDESIRIIHRALDAGLNFVDTADVYSQGESEVIVGKALAGGKREDVVLATKVWGQMGEGANRRGTSRRWIIQEVENSLRRLDTDWIDLYQIHRHEPGTDIDETLGASRTRIGQGKVRYAGSSTFAPSVIVEAQWIAHDRSLQRYVCEQPPYSMLVRGIEADVLPICARYGMGVVSYSPLAGGWLSGRWRKGSEQPGSTRAERLPQRYDLSLPANQRKLDAADQLARLADEAGIPLVRLATLRPQPPGRGLIIGPRTGATSGSPLRRGRRDRRGATRPHRRDRRSRHQHQPRRCQRAGSESGPGAGGAEAMRPSGGTMRASSCARPTTCSTRSVGRSRPPSAERRGRVARSPAARPRRTRGVQTF